MRRSVLTLFFISFAFSGCAAGPQAISMGRSVYREVINRTEDEQLLNLIVRDRYNETYGMLAVASVTASIRASAKLSADFGLTRSLSEDYEGNLVPLSGGVAYEENPTISYVPIGGEKFVQRLLGPLSTEELLLMGQYLPNRRDVHMRVALRSINGVRNPFVAEEGTGSATFNRIVDLWVHLARVGVSRVARAPNGEFQAVFHVDTTEHEAALRELLELTGIQKRPSDGWLLLPMRAAVPGQSEDAFNIESRSVLEILRTAGACIEIPEPHQKAGVLEARGDAQNDRFMRIRTSPTRPDGAGTIAVKYRGWWYYIDDADPASKQAFQFLRALVWLRLSERGKDTDAPVLTIPVR